MSGDVRDAFWRLTLYVGSEGPWSQCDGTTYDLAGDVLEISDGLAATAKSIAELERHHAACLAHIDQMERDRTRITNAVRLVPGASVDSIVHAITRMRAESDDAIETLAPEIRP
jgi:hypothetical protein